MAILLKFRHRCNGFPSAAVRSPDFDELAVPGQPTGRMSRCPLLAQSRHSSLCGFMSAIGGKADIVRVGDLCPLMTHSRLRAVGISTAISFGYDMKRRSRNVASCRFCNAYAAPCNNSQTPPPTMIAASPCPKPAPQGTIFSISTTIASPAIHTRFMTPPANRSAMSTQQQPRQ